MDSLVVAKAVTPGGVLTDARITFEGGRIVGIDEGAAGAEQLWAVPGYVDTHCHGAVEVSFGVDDLDANRRARAFHLSHGTTTLFASTVTLTMDELERQSAVLLELFEEGTIDGIHLEGPFLAPEKKGAHPLELLIDPTPDAVERLIAAGGPALKMITMAPERPHSMEAIARFVEAGVVVAFGHSDADADVCRRSIDAGATAATHLFNAMCGIHHREPGPVPSLLHDERILNELICDGVHLHADVIRLAHEAAGADRIALVTDAMSATGADDGRYMLGQLDVVVTDGVARLVTDDGSEGNIAGSTLTMAEAFRFVVSEVGLPIPEAAKMAATTPARYHRLPDVGELTVGKFADICLVDDAGALHGVIRRGERVTLDPAPVSAQRRMLGRDE